jgi:c-di-GMP-binding flagellar brake protein YcgR
MNLEPSKHVKLRLPGGEPLPAAVDEIDGTKITVALLLKAHQTLGLFTDRKATIEYADKKGLHKLVCTVLRALPGDRLLLESEPAEDVIQRRDYFRVEAYAPLTITTREETPRTLETSSHDLSGGGMLIADPLQIPADTLLDIQIKVGAGEPVRVVGRVIRNTGDKRTAVQILEIAPADRQELMRYTTERQRAALRVAGGRR